MKWQELRIAISARAILTSSIALSVMIAHPVYPRAGTIERLYVANNRRDDVAVVQVPAFNILENIVVGAQPHGLAAPASGNVLYVTTEASRQVHWINPYTHEIYKSVTVGIHPENLASTPDGRFLYVPCRDGHYWVLDARTGALITKIATGGDPHNTVASPDGRYMYLAPHDTPPEVWIVDTEADHAVVGKIPFPGGVRPVDVSADGTRLYANSGSLHGFYVADIATRKVLYAVNANEPGGSVQYHHGLAVRPDQGEVWTAGHYNTGWSFAFSRTPEPPTQIANIAGRGAYWITFSRTGKYGYLSLTREQHDTATNAYNGMIRVVNANTHEKVTDVIMGPGTSPKRTLSLLLSDAGAFQFSSNSVNVPEGGVATIVVTRAGEAKGEVSVRYSTRNATAVAPDDYTATTGTLTWGDGDTSNRIIQVQALSDQVAETTETVTLVLGNPTGGAVLAGVVEATLSITDMNLVKEK
ncbi:MAG: hypothetical protein OEM98_04425 [Gammaproteobacteria bacterium]|nr:hypothetical protein [Gammaproteobacteria bacterium]